MNSMYRIPNRIFVGGIPQSASQDELRDYFSHFGPVKDARIISDQRGNSRGYGFVTYDNENDATKVLSLKEEELMFKENRLNIGHAFRKKNFGGPGQGGQGGGAGGYGGGQGNGGMMHHNMGHGGAGGQGGHQSHHNHHHHMGSHNGSAGGQQMGLGQSSMNGAGGSSMSGYLDPQMGAGSMHPMVGGQGYGQANGINLGHLGGLNGHLGHMGGMNGINALSGMNMN